MKKRLMALFLGVMLMAQVMPQNVSAQVVPTTVTKSVQMGEYNAGKIAKVTGVKCTSSTNKSINICWKQVSGVTGYEILRADSLHGKYKNIMNVYAGNGAFCNRSVNAGTEYYYKVRAYVKRGGKIATGKVSKVLVAHTKLTKGKSGKTRVNTNVRKSAGTDGKYLTTLTKGTTVNLVCSTVDKKGTRWYKISAQSGKKKVSGYLRADLVTM